MNVLECANKSNFRHGVRQTLFTSEESLFPSPSKDATGG